MKDAESDTVEATQILGWAEFCAWSGLVMTPIIWWLQGASVSTDQFVVRTGLVVISACAGVGLRGWAIVQRRRAAKGARPGSRPIRQHECGECRYRFASQPFEIRAATIQ